MTRGTVASTEMSTARMPAPEHEDRTVPNESNRVLIIEDDEAVRVAVERGLVVLGFNVGAVADAETALMRIANHPRDVVIVDIGLPGMSGIELCTRLRALDIETPILILSALDQVSDRVAGLQAGADDYLVKPFDLEELTLRIRALLRRAIQPTGTCERVVAHGPLWLNLDRRIASYESTPLDLSRREFDLLAAFVANPAIVLSRIRLLELVWGYDFDTDTNVVDVFVGYLRRKLEVLDTRRLIETVRGVGFVLKVP